MNSLLWFLILLIPFLILFWILPSMCCVMLMRFCLDKEDFDRVEWEIMLETSLIPGMCCVFFWYILFHAKQLKRKVSNIMSKLYNFIDN